MNDKSEWDIDQIYAELEKQKAFDDMIGEVFAHSEALLSEQNPDDALSLLALMDEQVQAIQPGELDDDWLDDDMKALLEAIQNDIEAGRSACNAVKACQGDGELSEEQIRLLDEAEKMLDAASSPEQSASNDRENAAQRLTDEELKALDKSLQQLDEVVASASDEFDQKQKNPRHSVQERLKRVQTKLPLLLKTLRDHLNTLITRIKARQVDLVEKIKEKKAERKKDVDQADEKGDLASDRADSANKTVQSALLTFFQNDWTATDFINPDGTEVLNYQEWAGKPLDELLKKISEGADFDVAMLDNPALSEQHQAIVETLSKRISAFFLTHQNNYAVKYLVNHCEQALQYEYPHANVLVGALQNVMNSERLASYHADYLSRVFGEGGDLPASDRLRGALEALKSSPAHQPSDQKGAPDQKQRAAERPAMKWLKDHTPQKLSDARSAFVQQWRQEGSLPNRVQQAVKEVVDHIRKPGKN